MKRRENSAGIDAPDEAMFVAWAEALAAVEPPPSLRERVLARVRTEVPAGGLRTVRAAEGWVEFAPGIEIKMLYRDEASGTNTFLARLQPGVTMPEHGHGQTEECYVIEGEIALGDITVRAGDFHLAARGAHHGALSTVSGALLYLRVGWGEHVPEPASR